MTIAEMHNQVRLGVDKVDSFNTDFFDPEEIDVILNTSQDELIKQLTKEGLDRTQSKSDMLTAITARIALNAFQVQISVNKPNGYFIGLPNDYRKSIAEECSVTSTDCHGNAQIQRRKVIPITYDQYSTAVSNPFVKPDKDYCLRLNYEHKNSGFLKQVEIITNGEIPNTYYLDYLREPVKMQYGSEYATVGVDIDCELNIEAQQWIIEETVKQMLLSIESQRYPAKVQEQDKINY